MLEIVLRFMGTSGVFVGVIAVYTAMRNHTRQLDAQIFLAYSDRLQTVRHMLLTELLPIWTAELSPDELSRILPGLLQVMHLIHELYELRAQGYVKTRMWAIWSRDIDRFLTTPIVRGLRDEIRLDFHGHGAFLDWIEQRQAVPS
ncbi:hypothetical protein [Sphingomonas sp. PL20]|jgi:hypothetical protein|uniref:hypothetical protein n=1 Tax=Sphingomonas sp. PL20 TaxID=2760712 RepID=UPI002FEF8E60